MKKMMAGFVVMLVFGAVAHASGMWTDNFSDASKKAASEQKYMLVNFTGSDWCGWCIKLDGEVFSQPAFKDYAGANLVPVIIDFPRRKELSPGIIQQNYDLQEKYGVMGYPTILVLAPDGSLVEKTGYRPGGPDEYIKHLAEIIESHRNAAADTPAQ